MTFFSKFLREVVYMKGKEDEEEEGHKEDITQLYEDMVENCYERTVEW